MTILVALEWIVQNTVKAMSKLARTLHIRNFLHDKPSNTDCTFDVYNIEIVTKPFKKIGVSMYHGKDYACVVTQIKASNSYTAASKKTNHSKLQVEKHTYTH